MKMRHGLVVASGPGWATVTLDGVDVDVLASAGRELTVGLPATLLQQDRTLVALSTWTEPVPPPIVADWIAPCQVDRPYTGIADGWFYQVPITESMPAGAIGLVHAHKNWQLADTYPTTDSQGNVYVPVYNPTDVYALFQAWAVECVYPLTAGVDYVYMGVTVYNDGDTTDSLFSGMQIKNPPAGAMVVDTERVAPGHIISGVAPGNGGAWLLAAAFGDNPHTLTGGWTEQVDRPPPGNWNAQRKPRTVAGKVSGNGAWSITSSATAPPYRDSIEVAMVGIQ